MAADAKISGFTNEDINGMITQKFILLCNQVHLLNQELNRLGCGSFAEAFENYDENADYSSRDELITKIKKTVEMMETLKNAQG